MKRPWHACGLSLALGLVGCRADPDPPPPDAGDGGPACDFALELGHLDAGVFVAYEEGDPGPVVRGFQGFRFLDLTARLSGVEATVGAFRNRATVEGLAPVVQDTNVNLEGEGGVLYAQHVLVFFNDVPTAQLLGREAEIASRATAAGCVGLDTVTLALEDGGCMGPDNDAGIVFDAGSELDGGDACADAGP